MSRFKTSFSCAAAALLCFFVPGGLLGQSVDARSLQPIFDGRSFDGWRGSPHQDPSVFSRLSDAEKASKQAAFDEDLRRHWTIENGELRNDGEGVFMTTVRSFGDLEMELEYCTVPLADSGVYLRGTPQVQIWDFTEAGGKWPLGADKGSGGLWNNQRFERFPSKVYDRPFGEWNHLRVRQVGARTWVWLNGHVTVDGVIMENFWNREAPLPRTGPIMLQTHGGEIRWRKILARELSPDEANEILAGRDSEGYRRFFDGRSLDGFAGATDDYEVVTGAIQCRRGRGGTLYTKERFSDFEARLEFQLPEGGNNGIAIRYPGSGDPAYAGMCEVQVLDDEHKRYEKIAPWQRCGSIYGLLPAHAGYVRPPPAWNFYEIRVKGPRIEVELNGTVVSEADLSTIVSAPSGKEHPGRLLKEGHFGFAGHNDPVRFRRLAIRSSAK